MKGNPIDIAIRFVMGAAFGKVSSTFTAGIISPLVGLLIGGVDFAGMKWVITYAQLGPDGVETVSEVALTSVLSSTQLLIS